MEVQTVCRLIYHGSPNRDAMEKNSKFLSYTQLMQLHKYATATVTNFRYESKILNERYVRPYIIILQIIQKACNLLDKIIISNGAEVLIN